MKRLDEARKTCPIINSVLDKCELCWYHVGLGCIWDDEGVEGE
jgi:hypothetical protein